MVSINPKLVIPAKLTLPQGNNEGGKDDNEGVKSPSTNDAPYKPDVSIGEINTDALLVNNGIKINKPTEPKDPRVTTQAVIEDAFDKSKERIGDFIDRTGAKKGDYFYDANGNRYYIHRLERDANGNITNLILL